MRADKKSRRKPAGKGWHGDSERHAKAGQKGGEATADTYGREFYSQIGRKGGRQSAKKTKKGGTRRR